MQEDLGDSDPFANLGRQTATGQRINNTQSSGHMNIYRDNN